ncbi:hypothetical protein Q1695_000271 [Nippostrongylus brasiliensis]|nr:hypothetical protein Q1695_000271 [Nippostrongylus brasiliensis]
MTSQVCVIMDAPASVRTRLISPTPPFSTESNDYFFIYVSLIVTVTMLLSSAFLVWRWGLHGLGTHLSVVLAMVLLAFNAYLGARTWADLRRQHREYLKHRLVKTFQVTSGIIANEILPENSPELSFICGEASPE